MAEQPVGKRGTQDGTEVAVADRVGSRQRAVKRPIDLSVVAQRIIVVLGIEQETIHPLVIVLNAPAVIRMIRIGMPASGEITRQMMRPVMEPERVLESKF